MQEASTISQLDGNSNLQYGSLYVAFTLKAGISGVATAYMLSGLTSTGDWYMVGVGYDLSSIGYYSQVAGCSSSGFEELLYIAYSGDESGDAACETSVTFAAGDAVVLGLAYDSSNGDINMEACAASSCYTYPMSQPDSGATGLEASTTYRYSVNGGFTGTMTWVMDPSAGACQAYTGMPEVDYDYYAGVYTTEYIPWSQSWYTPASGSSTVCYSYASGIVTFSPNSAPTIYTEATGGSGYGPHWVAGQNVSLQSALSPSYWWRFQTDVSPLSTPTVTQSRATADSGQSVTYTGSASGGIAAYQYTWYLNSALQGTVSSPWAWIASSTPGSYSVYAYVIDSDYDEYGPSSSVTVSVTSDPTIAAPTASPPSGGIDQGQNVTFTSAVPVGGLASFTYSWTSLPTGCASSASTTVKCAPTASGTFPVVDTATDTNGYLATSPSLSYMVDGPLSAGLTVAPKVIDLGQSFNLTVTSAGGATPYTLAYVNLPAGCNSASTSPLLCKPTANGTYPTLKATVTDANTAVVTTTPVSVTVNPKLGIGGFVAAPSNFTNGTGTYLNVSVSGGTTPYTFSYTALPPGCTTSNVSSLKCTPSAYGNYTVSVTVKDAVGVSVGASTTIHVAKPIPPLKIVSFVANPATITQGASTNLTVTLYGGVYPYVYSYSGLPKGCSSANVSVLLCTPQANGTFSVGVKVTDIKGSIATGSASLSVSPVVESAPRISSFDASPNPINFGQSTNFTVSVSGGAAPYTYVYTGLPAGCPTADSGTLPCTPSTTGSFNVSVKVTDLDSKTASSTTLLKVNTNSGGSGPSISSIIANPNPVRLGQMTNISVNAYGGTPPYSYAYGGLPPGCSSSNSNPISCKPQSIGNYSFNVTVTDTKGKKASASASLEVTGSASQLIVSLVSNLTTVKTGQSFTLTASVSGGVGPFEFTWSLNGTTDSNGPDLSTWTLTLAHPGNYTYSVSVRDTQGKSVASNSVNVEATRGAGSGTPPNGGGGGGSSSPVSFFPWWVVLVILAVVTLLLVLVAGRQRRTLRRELPMPMYAPAGIAPAVGPEAGWAPVPGQAMEGAAGGTAVGEFGDQYPEATPAPSAEYDANQGGEYPPQPMDAGMASPEQSPGPCPQCGGALDANMFCVSCGATWLTDQPPSPELASPAPAENVPTEQLSDLPPETYLPPPPESTPPPPQEAPVSQPEQVERVEPVAPVTSPIQCPQCGGPLDLDMTCKACGGGWYAQQQPLPDEQQMTNPEPAPEYVSQEPAPDHFPPNRICPNCNSPVGSDMVCLNCGRGWVPDHSVPPPDSIPSEVSVSSYPPSETESEPAQPETSGAGPVELIPAPEQAPPASPQDAAEVAEIERALEKAKTQPAPAEEAKPAPVTPPPPHKCIICGSEPEGDYCKTCDMHWESQG
jgi:hypothetical protein